MWRKSRRSSPQGDACVEVAQFGGVVGVRDSKDPEGPKLMITHQAFRALVQELGAGIDQQ
jgi:hypothetical protein